MSLYTQSKIASVNTPAIGKSRQAYLSTKNAECWVDENGAQWWYGKQRVVLAADASALTSSTLSDVTGLGFSVLASVRYGFRFVLLYQTSVITSGLKISVTCPASPTIISASASIFGFAADGTAG